MQNAKTKTAEFTQNGTTTILELRTAGQRSSTQFCSPVHIATAQQRLDLVAFSAWWDLNLYLSSCPNHLIIPHAFIATVLLAIFLYQFTDYAWWCSQTASTGLLFKGTGLAQPKFKEFEVQNSRTIKALTKERQDFVCTSLSATGLSIQLDQCTSFYAMFSLSSLSLQQAFWRLCTPKNQDHFGLVRSPFVFKKNYVYCIRHCSL